MLRRTCACANAHAFTYIHTSDAASHMFNHKKTGHLEQSDQALEEDECSEYENKDACLANTAGKKQCGFAEGEVGARQGACP